MTYFDKKIANLIRTKRARIGIIGLGYVGLPLAHAFATKGFAVVGIDIDPAKINMLQKRRSYINDLSSKDLMKLKKFEATSDYSVIGTLDVVIVCVPTPLNRAKDPDISYIVASAESILSHLSPGKLIVLESTTYPGTTEEVILPTLAKSNLKVGNDFFLCFSPERIDPGNADFNTQNIPKVVGGVTTKCAELGAALYSCITPKVLKVSSPRAAEMTKLLENTFRIVNIGLINELAKAASYLKVNIWEVIDAAKSKPFGFMPFYPGPGIGGHCIGVDPIYLSWKARMQGIDLHFIELARRINVEMPAYVVSQAVYALNQFAHKAISRSKILVLGVSYKKDVPDIRESPALDIIYELKRLGCDVQYHDPFVDVLEHHGVKLKSKALNLSQLKKFDLVILATNHTQFPYSRIAKNSKLIYDTRNAFQGLKARNIVRL